VTGPPPVPPPIPLSLSPPQSLSRSPPQSLPLSRMSTDDRPRRGKGGGVRFRAWVGSKGTHRVSSGEAPTLRSHGHQTTGGTGRPGRSAFRPKAPSGQHLIAGNRSRRSVLVVVGCVMSSESPPATLPPRPRHTPGGIHFNTPPGVGYCCICIPPDDPWRKVRCREVGIGRWVPEGSPTIAPPSPPPTAPPAAFPSHAAGSPRLHLRPHRHRRGVRGRPGLPPRPPPPPRVHPPLPGPGAGESSGPGGGVWGVGGQACGRWVGGALGGYPPCPTPACAQIRGGGILSLSLSLSLSLFTFPHPPTRVQILHPGGHSTSLPFPSLSLR